MLFFIICAQPVQEPLAVALMHPLNYTPDFDLPPPVQQASKGWTDTVGKLIDKKSTEQFKKELAKWVFYHCPKTMALSGQ